LVRVTPHLQRQLAACARTKADSEVRAIHRYDITVQSGILDLVLCVSAALHNYGFWLRLVDVHQRNGYLIVT